MTNKRAALISASYEYEDNKLSHLIAPFQDAQTLAQVLSDPEIGNFEVELSINEPSYTMGQKIAEFFLIASLKMFCYSTSLDMVLSTIMDNYILPALIQIIST